MIIASRPLQMVLYQPELLPFVMDAITEGWARGRKRNRCFRLPGKIIGTRRWQSFRPNTDWVKLRQLTE